MGQCGFHLIDVMCAFLRRFVVIRVFYGTHLLVVVPWLPRCTIEYRFVAPILLISASRTMITQVPHRLHFAVLASGVRLLIHESSPHVLLADGILVLA